MSGRSILHDGVLDCVNDAAATVASDRDMIMNVIREEFGSHAAADRLLEKAIREGALRFLRGEAYRGERRPGARTGFSDWEIDELVGLAQRLGVKEGVIRPDGTHVADGYDALHRLCNGDDPFEGERGGGGGGGGSDGGGAGRERDPSVVGGRGDDERG